MPFLILDLPLELIRKIASLVRNRQALSNASKAGSRLLRQVFQEYLFSAILLESSQLSPCKLYGLVYCSDNEIRSRFTGYISSVKVRHEFPHHWAVESATMVIPAEVSTTLAFLPRLTSLNLVFATFKWNQLDLNQLRDILALLRLPTLSQLTDRSLPYKRFPLCLLPFCPNIQQLKMKDYLANTEAYPVEEGYPALSAQAIQLLIPSTPVFLRHLHLSGLALISYFADFSNPQHHTVRCSEVDLHYLDGHTLNTTSSRAPSDILGRFFRNVGNSIKKMRLHVTRFQPDNGTKIPMEDLLHLTQLRSLEITLTIDMVTSKSDVKSFLDDWLLSFLKALARLQALTHLRITYEIHVMRYTTPPDLGTLGEAWGMIDKVLASYSSLREFSCIVIMIQAQRSRKHGGACWEGKKVVQQGTPPIDASAQFPRLCRSNVQFKVEIFDLPFKSAMEYD
ncbi:hypothetical protein NP233_g8813 [Leucocoprinus birnbaumii]|uniref:Uncharacterized protein n=1 Tax=Leucocoprinus birnbaumii TaxID=56174 RepID=A0AAD5YTD1_9AGAR|nr:hypothetical protein NP233_g8813 [Leucocoprinus birnbaumii]